MKTNFRDEFNQFDDAFNIEETTINENIGIDPEKIKADVMSKISSGKKKQSRNKVTFILIAAAVSAAVVGTTVIATSGVLNPRFEQVLSGDVSSLPIHETKIFSFDSPDENLQAEFAGYVNDGERYYASVILTRKDDTPFAKADDMYYSESTVSKDFYLRHANLSMDEYADTLKKEWGKTDFNYVCYGTDSNGTIMDDLDYDLRYTLSSDGKEIIMYFATQYALDEYFTDCDIRILSDHAQTCTYKDLLAQCNSMDSQGYYDSMSLIENRNMVKSDYRWVIRDGKYNLYSLEPKDLDLKYDISFRLSYVNDSEIKKELTSQNAPSIVKDGTKAEMKITPVGIVIESSRDISVSEANKLQNFLMQEDDKPISEDYPYVDHPEALTSFARHFDYNGDWYTYDMLQTRVIMKDGTVRYLVRQSGGIKTGVDGDEVNIEENDLLYYSEEPVENDMLQVLDTGMLGDYRPLIVDPQNIAKVVLNSITVYQAPDAGEIVDPLEEPSRTPPDVLSITPGDIRSFIQDSMNNNDVQLVSLSFASDEDMDDARFLSTSIEITFEGTKENIKQTLIKLIDLEEKGIYLSKVAVNESENKNFICADVYMDAPYATQESGLDNETAEKVIKQIWGALDRKNLIERCVDGKPGTELNFLTGSETDNADNTSEDQDIINQELFIMREPTEARPEKMHKIENFSFKNWTDEDVKGLVAKYGEECNVKASDKKIDPDYQEFGYNCFVLECNAAKEKLTELLTKLKAEEANNLFVSRVTVNSAADNKFSIIVELVNPFANSENYDKTAAENYVQLYYGLNDWSKSVPEFLRLLNDKFKNAVMEVKTGYYDGRKTSEELCVSVTVEGIFKTYDEFITWRQSVNSQKDNKYSFSEAMTIENAGNVFKATFEFYSTAFAV